MLKGRLPNGKLAYVPAVLFLVVAFTRPERRVVWLIIALIFFMVALRKSRAAPDTPAP